jgi:hypothetical protein
MFLLSMSLSMYQWENMIRGNNEGFGKTPAEE